MGNFCPYYYAEDYLSENLTEIDMSDNIKHNIDYFTKEKQLLEKGLNKLITPNGGLEDKPNQYEKWSKSELENRIRVVDSILYALRVIYSALLAKRKIDLEATAKFYLNLKKNFYLKKDEKDKLGRETKKFLMYLNTIED